MFLYFQKRNAIATDDVELGVVDPECASDRQSIDVAYENEPGGCRDEMSSEDLAEGRTRLRHIDSEVELGGRGGEVRGLLRAVIPHRIRSVLFSVFFK